MMKKEHEIKSGLRFLDYIVDSVEFYTNSQYEEKGSVKVDFKIAHEIIYIEDSDMGVTLNVKIFENPTENNCGSAEDIIFSEFSPALYINTLV